MPVLKTLELAQYTSKLSERHRILTKSLTQDSAALGSFLLVLFAHQEESGRLSGKTFPNEAVTKSSDSSQDPRPLHPAEPRTSHLSQQAPGHLAHLPTGPALCPAPPSPCRPLLHAPPRSALRPGARALAPPPPAPQRPRRRAQACACALRLKSGRALARTRRAAGGAANGRRRCLAAGRRGLRGC